MKIEATIKALVEVTAVKVSAEVRYWEDAEVNGKPDTEQGDNVPMRNGKLWEPTIDLDRGFVHAWPPGTTASIHYKVCDAGIYELISPDGEVVARKDGYVPSFLAVKERGFGDYIILDIGADGVIDGWGAPEIDAEQWTWIDL